MNLSWPDQKKLLEEVLQNGKESAAELQTLLEKPLDNHGSVSATELAVKILRSFTDSLSVLGPIEISQIAAADGVNRGCSRNRSSKTTAGKRKNLGVKDRRGSYRKRNVSDIWIEYSSNKEDAYAWRKYGQKQILNSKFPRCYFRCTHKIDQGCKATKQVQRDKQDPLLFKTTYFGHHTCHTDILRAPKIIQETDPMDSSYLLSFETEVPAASKQKLKEDTHSDVSDNKSLQASTIWHDLMATDGSSGPVKVMPSEAGSAHFEEVGSVYSSSSNTLQGFDMEAFSEFDLDNKNLYDFEKDDFLVGSY